MSVCSDIADYKWLTGSEAAAYLAELAASAEPLHTSIERLRRSLSPAKAHLLLEQVELRRRAREKFKAADRMFFTRVGLEQATDEWVARYKAARFAEQRAQSASTIADFCCGIGGDLIALSAHSAVVGVDRDPVAAYFADVNSSLFNVADRVAIVTGPVENFQLYSVAAWHIDPDRRATGRRTTTLESCQPSLATVERFLSQAANAAVKLAPATKVPLDWAHCCELEWISRDGECRQLVAWHGELARSPGLRRATVLTTSAANRGASTLAERGSAPDAFVRTICGLPDHPLSVPSKLGNFIFDVDPAVRAARLQGALAAELNLSPIAPGASYFTGDSPIHDAAVSCFKIDDVLPLRVPALAQLLRERGIGGLEIKKRGVEIDPEKLRRELKLRGDNAATLLITPIASRPTAIVAQRIP